MSVGSRHQQPSIASSGRRRRRKKHRGGGGAHSVAGSGTTTGTHDGYADQFPPPGLPRPPLVAAMPYSGGTLPEYDEQAVAAYLATIWSTEYTGSTLDFWFRYEGQGRGPASEHTPHTGCFVRITRPSNPATLEHIKKLQWKVNRETWNVRAYDGTGYIPLFRLLLPQILPSLGVPPGDRQQWAARMRVGVKAYAHDKFPMYHCITYTNDILAETVRRRIVRKERESRNEAERRLFLRNKDKQRERQREREKRDQTSLHHQYVSSHTAAPAPQPVFQPQDLPGPHVKSNGTGEAPESVRSSTGNGTVASSQQQPVVKKRRRVKSEASKSVQAVAHPPPPSRRKRSRQQVPPTYQYHPATYQWAPPPPHPAAYTVSPYVAQPQPMYPPPYPPPAYQTAPPPPPPPSGDEEYESYSSGEEGEESVIK